MSSIKQLRFEFKKWVFEDQIDEPIADNTNLNHSILNLKLDLPIDDKHPLKSFDQKFYLSNLNIKELQEISLVLSSQNIEHWSYSYKNNWLLFVDAEIVSQSQKTLRLYIQENIKQKSEIPNLELRLSPFLILIIPMFFYFWSMSGIFDSFAIRQAGKSIAANIIDGQWWRTITALTLHADAKHFLSNFISGFFILNLLFLRRDPAKSSLVILLASALTNYMVALTMRENFSSLGFSTYVFSALGALALVEVVENKNSNLNISLSRRLQPLYSAFFVAVMLGIGENSDILAHFYGFGLGFVVSAFFLNKSNSRDPLSNTWSLLIIFYLVFFIAWYFAYFRYIN